MTDNKPIAAQIIAQGFPVFPCHSDGTGGKPKSPMTGNGFEDAALDASPWERKPCALVGMPPPPGCIVVDTDEKNGYCGEETLREAGVIEAADKASLIVQTPGGGVHRYFAVDDVSRFKNTSGVNGLPCVDLRVYGKGYVIAPGAAYSLGTYQPIKGGVTSLKALAPMPAELDRLLCVPPPTLSQQAMAEALKSGRPARGFLLDQDKFRLSDKGRQRLEKRLAGLFKSLINGIEMAMPGTRHTTLLRNGRTLAGYLHYEAFTRADLEAGLLGANAMNGRISDDGENVVKLTIKAAIDDGETKPLLLQDRVAGGVPFPFERVARGVA